MEHYTKEMEKADEKYGLKKLMGNKKQQHQHLTSSILMTDSINNDRNQSEMYN